MMSALQNLTEKLRGVLKEARLVATPLPLTPEIQLYLLSPDYPQRALTDEERRVLMDDPPYWAFCWSSGQVLARWIRDRRTNLAGKRVLDFGSGSGIAAIAAALAGAREVIALDTDPLACEAIRANAELNSVTIAVAQHWEAVPGDFDVILVADVLYDRNNLPLLDSLTARAEFVLVADSRVRELPEPYTKIGSGRGVTYPDLEEPEEFQNVAIFTSLPQAEGVLPAAG